MEDDDEGGGMKVEMLKFGRKWRLDYVLNCGGICLNYCLLD